MAEPTDLYYNGVNSAGFTTIGNSIKFEGSYMQLSSGQGGTALFSGKDYNFIGYNNMQFTLFFPSNISASTNPNYVRGIGIKAIYEDDILRDVPSATKVVLDQRALNYAGQTKTYNISLSTVQTTFKKGFPIFFGNLSNVQIKRIRLIK